MSKDCVLVQLIQYCGCVKYTDGWVRRILAVRENSSNTVQQYGLCRCTCTVVRRLVLRVLVDYRTVMLLID